MQLLLITPPETINNEIMLVCHCLEQGLHKLHVRKPLFDAAAYRRYLEEIPVAFHPRVVVHGAYDLVKEFPAIGVHVRSAGRADMRVLQQVRALNPASRSSSFHGWEEIRDDSTAWDYVFISPVFDSISKKDYPAGIDLNGCGEFRASAAPDKKQVPGIVGLGGVCSDNIALLRQHGFDGAALLGAVWQSADPAAAFNAILRATGSRAGH